VTKIDAKQMKQETFWSLRSRTNGTFKEFETGLTAALEHHFDNHEHCGNWCKAKEKEVKKKKKHDEIKE
jgi:hypothetical protein